MKQKIVSNDEVNQVVQQLRDLAVQEKALAKSKELLKQQLYNFMNENDVLIDYETGEEIVSWSYSEGYMKFDAKKFMEDKPKIYKQYLFKTEPVRTLRVTK